MGSKLFHWVPDGVFDKRDFLVRYQITDGMPVTVISKMWLDQGGPADVVDSLRQPWGTFPDMPPRPAKR
jgi:hypothetical protein